MKNPKARIAKAAKHKHEIEALKRERKQYRRGLEKEWKFGTAALVVGLKYNASQDKFFARIAYSKKSTRGAKFEEDVLVPPHWIQWYKYKSDVIQHVINMGQTDKGFIIVPPGMDIHVQNRAISQLKYIPASIRRQPIPNEDKEKGNSIVRGKQLRKRRAADDMIETPVPPHWLVKFAGETKALRVNDDFVSAFNPDFLNEVKRMKSGGFVDIPVGDFKLSNLEEHPKLVVANAPVLHYRQSDGQDLCVSKSLASVLHALQFESAASQVNEFGEKMGGAVNVIRKSATMLKKSSHIG